MAKVSSSYSCHVSILKIFDFKFNNTIKVASFRLDIEV